MKKILLVLLVVLGLQTQAQITPCDSVGYTITSSGGSTLLQLNGTPTSGFSGYVLTWDWSVCDPSLCFTDTGQTASFSQFSITDTLKACLTTLLEINNNIYTCMQCDSLVYDGFGGWMLMNMGNPTAITELTSYNEVDGKIYDVLGREWTCSFTNLPKGLYIINNRKVLKTE
jgi:hypothetical protein